MKKPGRRHGRPGLWSSAATPLLQPFDAVVQIGEVLASEGAEQHDEATQSQPQTPCGDDDDQRMVEALAIRVVHDVDHPEEVPEPPGVGLGAGDLAGDGVQDQGRLLLVRELDPPGRQREVARLKRGLFDPRHRGHGRRAVESRRQPASWRGHEVEGAPEVMALGHEFAGLGGDVEGGSPQAFELHPPDRRRTSPDLAGDFGQKLSLHDPALGGVDLLGALSGAGFVDQRQFLAGPGVEQRPAALLTDDVDRLSSCWSRRRLLARRTGRCGRRQRRLIADVARRGVEVRRLADHLDRIGSGPALIHDRQAGVRAPVRIAAVAAADMTVEDDRIAALERRDDVFVQIGGVPVQAGATLTDVEGVAHADVHALHRLQTRIGGLGRQIVDLARQRVAGEAVRLAERMVHVRRRIADRQLGRTGDGADSVLDLDVEIVGRQRQAADLRRLPHQAQSQGFGAFRLQHLIAADRGQDAVAHLHIARRHARGGAVGDQHGVAAVAVAAARIGRGQVALSHTAVQFRHAGNTEARAIGGAQTQAVDHRPVQAQLIGGVAAEQIIVRVTDGRIQIEPLHERQVAQQGRRQFDIGFLGLGLARDRILLIGVGDAQHRQGVGITPALLFAIDQARRHRQGAGRQFHDRAADIEGEALLLVPAGVARVEQNVVQHVLINVAHAQIVAARHGGARRRAAQRGVQRIAQPLQVDDVGHAVDAGVAAPVGRSLPGPVAGDVAARSTDEAVGVRFLEELTLARLDQQTADQQQILAGRVGRVIGRDADVAQGARRRRLIALAVGEEQLAEQADLVGQLIVGQHGRAEAFDRRGGVQIAVGVVVVLGRVIRLVEVSVPARRLVEVDHLPVRQNRAAAGRRGAGDAGQGAVHLAQAARRAAGQVDLFGFLIGQGGGDAAPVVLDAPQDVEGHILTVAFIGDAVLARHLQAFIAVDGDDVHHPGHSVRSIDGRGPVLQHVHAGDDRRRDHVQVGGAVGAGAAVDHATTVDQRQGPVDAQAAQVHLRRAVAVAGPVGVGLTAGRAGRRRRPRPAGSVHRRPAAIASRPDAAPRPALPPSRRGPIPRPGIGSGRRSASAPDRLREPRPREAGACPAAHSRWGRHVRPEPATPPPPPSVVPRSSRKHARRRNAKRWPRRPAPRRRFPERSPPRSRPGRRRHQPARSQSSKPTHSGLHSTRSL
uniref:PE-PGRS family protein n=1 Tax=Parastrongyloides trichosuri TaxID=131310 RepID=A0A0N4Z2Z1_PARTI